MAHKIRELDVVALLRDIPKAKLAQGQVGTVVNKAWRIGLRNRVFRRWW